VQKAIAPLWVNASLQRNAGSRGRLFLKVQGYSLKLGTLVCWVKLFPIKEILSCDMHVITRKRLNEFAEKHPETATALAHWYNIVKKHNFNSLVDVRSYFPSADPVGNLTVFNIGGNKVRLIAALHYNRRRLYIRAILTHAEYDEGKWKE
jgi:mRNA interferase HigB